MPFNITYINSVEQQLNISRTKAIGVRFKVTGYPDTYKAVKFLGIPENMRSIAHIKCGVCAINSLCTTPPFRKEAGDCRPSHRSDYEDIIFVIDNDNYVKLNLTE